MADIEKLIRDSGFIADDLVVIDLGTPTEISRQSLQAFVTQQSGDDAASLEESRGLLHFTGPAIVGHSVPISVVGSTLLLMQNVIDAIGATKEGLSSIGEQIPNRVKARTELRMDALPISGSVEIRVRPSMARDEDMNPGGQARPDIDEVEIRPLADECIEDFITILSIATDYALAPDELVGLLSEYGPRTLSAVREFCKALDKDSLDIDIKWEEPKQRSIRGEMSHSRAKYVSSIIKDATIAVDEVSLVRSPTIWRTN